MTRAQKRRQFMLKRQLARQLFWYSIIILIIMIICLIAAINKSNPMKVEAEDSNVNKWQYISEISKNDTRYGANLVRMMDEYECNNLQEITEQQAKSFYDRNVNDTRFEYSKDWSKYETYLLAKIAMAEAEGESIECKEKIILVILNRVWSDKFPNTIHDVIFEQGQFTPINNGRWDKVEPNEECYEAVNNVMMQAIDDSEGATYFECCEDENNWHSRNLEFLYEIDGTRFYREK